LAVVHLGQYLAFQPARKPLVYRRRADIGYIDFAGSHGLLEQRAVAEGFKFDLQAFRSEQALLLGDDSRRVGHRVHPADPQRFGGLRRQCGK
jgi:hypothetical protein